MRFANKFEHIFMAGTDDCKLKEITNVFLIQSYSNYSLVFILQHKLGQNLLTESGITSKIGLWSH